MLAKHPLELPKDRNLTKEEIADALRLSTIAELDAINLYLQLARASGDKEIRKVFEDVAKEEKTHVGEFLALLKNIDPEQMEELKRGLEEIKELTGMKVELDPPKTEAGLDVLSSSEWSNFYNAFLKAADESRVLRKYLPLNTLGRGFEFVSVDKIVISEGVISPGKPAIVPLEEISVKFRISQKTLDRERRLGRSPIPETGLFAAAQLGFSEDKFVLDRILSCENAEKSVMSDWSKGGAAVEDVSKAINIMVNNGVPGPYLLILSPRQYSKLVMVYERTGVMELTRVERLVSNIIQLPHMPDDMAVLLSANSSMLDITLGADTILDYLGPENGSHLFRAWETLALRIKYPKAIVLLKSS